MNLTRRQKDEARRLRQAMVRNGVDFETATRAAMEAVRR